MSQSQTSELTAADIRTLLKKFPATTQNEKIYVSIILTLLESQETTEAQVKGVAELLGRLLHALEIDPRTLMTMPMTAKTKVEDKANSVNGSAASGPVDKTPFPTGVAVSGPPGSEVRVTVTSTEEAIPQPNVQSGPPMNPRPNITPPPVNGAPKAS